MTSKCGKTDKQVANKATGECVIAQQQRIYLFYSIKKKKNDGNELCICAYRRYEPIKMLEDVTYYIDFYGPLYLSCCSDHVHLRNPLFSSGKLNLHG